MNLRKKVPKQSLIIYCQLLAVSCRLD